MPFCLNIANKYSPRTFFSSERDHRFISFNQRKKISSNQTGDRTAPLIIAGVKCTPIKKTPRNRLKSKENSSLLIISNDFRSFSNLEFYSDQRHYSTKRPYPSAWRKIFFSSPPEGFHPIAVQVLARHGSRTLAHNNYDERVLRIWRIAHEKNQLTSFGHQLKDDVELFMEANNCLGRGELTSVGRDEHRGIAKRLYQRLEQVFHQRPTISVMTSGKKRAVDSAAAFVSSLIESKSSIEILEEKINKKLLYFHKSCKHYLQFKHHNVDVKSKLNFIKNLEKTRIYARHVLRKIYRDDFVNLLINGVYENSSEKTEVDTALCLYSLFSVALAHGPSSPIRHLLAKYFNQEESNWFAYINDAEEFYTKGPSIQGNDATFNMARPLLFDFFSSIEKNPRIGAALRFAHAETIIPFATILQIPGISDQPVDRTDLYTYEKNNWRGDRVSPMAANIQWEIFQHRTDSNRILVRMLYNEIEVKFKSDCSPITKSSFFYDFNELKRAYAHFLS